VWPPDVWTLVVGETKPFECIKNNFNCTFDVALAIGIFDPDNKFAFTLLRDG
jgi:hypothetical protein